VEIDIGHHREQVVITLKAAGQAPKSVTYDLLWEWGIR
jgi:hypothetical protein